MDKALQITSSESQAIRETSDVEVVDLRSPSMNFEEEEGKNNE